ncbi:uncharacterized protein DS421_16g542610 [Arachis hypogaea]|nr:uncharacterized protein DS421_16g542610 [Arachis hypogaea]
MSEEKKMIVRGLGFGGLMHIPPLRVHHQVLRELANNFKLGENRLKTGYGDLFPQKVDYKKLSEDDKEIFRRFQGKTLKSLTDEMMDIGVGNEEDRLMFKRIFILYIQMAFLLPTTINKISPVHLAPIFEMDTITERNWGEHVLSKKRAERPPKPWIANWSKKQLDERMSAEIEENMGIVKMAQTREKMKKIEKKEKKQEIKKTKKRKASSTSSSEKETTDSDSSTSESETQEDSEDSPRKQPSKKGKKMDSKKRKKSQEDSDSESESIDESEESSPVKKQKRKKKTQRTPKKTQSKKKKVVVEHSSPEEDQSYDGYSTSYEIGSEDLDELLRENNEKSAAEGEKQADLRSTEGHYVSSETLSLVEESPSEPTDSNMMVVRKETPSEGLAIVPIQVCLPVSQTTTVPKFEETPETEYEPTPLLQIEGPTKTTPEPPQQLEESTATLPPAPSKSTPELPQQLEESTPTLLPAPSKTYPAPEDAAALLMMARTASYIPRTDPLPSFSLAFTDSSQEEATTQEGASTQEADKAKTPETAILLEQLDDLVQKIASSAAKEESKSPQIQKETGGESSGKFETPAGINQNTVDMKEKCYIWGTRVKTYADGRTNEFDNVCTLIAQDKYILTRMHLASLQAESYIEAEIVSAMCLILNQKNDKRFREQVYCLPPNILNMAIWKHPNGEFISPKTNKEFRVEDYPIMRAYAGGASLKKNEKEKEIKTSYGNISGQKSNYDCAIYVMKWLELTEPENIKRVKYE